MLPSAEFTSYPIYDDLISNTKFHFLGFLDSNTFISRNFSIGYQIVWMSDAV